MAEEVLQEQVKYHGLINHTKIMDDDDTHRDKVVSPQYQLLNKTQPSSREKSGNTGETTRPNTSSDVGYSSKLVSGTMTDDQGCKLEA